MVDNVIEIPHSAFKPGVLEGFLADLQDEKYLASLGYTKKDEKS